MNNPSAVKVVSIAPDGHCIFRGRQFRTIAMGGSAILQTSWVLRISQSRVGSFRELAGVGAGTE